VLPLGYYAPRGDEAALHRALVELPEQVGEFEKATFFQLDPSLCAHGRRGLNGCRRCLDACPTGAIRSAGDSITVDPYYCQGAGSCATVCPTGAIVYSYPYPADRLERLRVLLRAYREAGGSDPILLFHDSHCGRERFDGLGDRWPGRVIAIELEELGSAGLETWLAALAYGADQIVLLATPPLPPSVRWELIEQLAVAHALLSGLGYPTTALRWLDAPGDDTALLAAVTAGAGMPVRQPAGFAGSNRKRDTLYYALDALAAESPLQPDIIPLPPCAPFGEVQVNRAVCTLCLACVTVCPGKALHDGGNSPRLELLEADCVQCGLCAVACPEHAITLQPRFLNDLQQRRQRRLLHEELPFCCIACGKPFATHRLVEMMTTKLHDHPMFRDAAALRRLQMCGDCRVRDLLGDAGSN
jgi:ferredoxin